MNGLSRAKPSWLLIALYVLAAASGAADAPVHSIETHEIRIPGGPFTSLAKIPHPPTDVAPFYIDSTLVTRAQFQRFTEQTGYRTSAERAGFGMVAQEGMLDWEWHRVAGATFRRPFAQVDAHTDEFLRDDAPVVMVSYDDAEAYCAHVGKRLPSEAEWERAMRGPRNTRFPWGDKAQRHNGQYGLNFWQGVSHKKNVASDGFVYVSPVRAFLANERGIFDPVGNVWQWTSDWFEGGEKRVLRGGSWWCGQCACSGYGLFFRGKAKPRAAFNNNGFRCARSLGS